MRNPWKPDRPWPLSPRARRISDFRGEPGGLVFRIGGAGGVALRGGATVTRDPHDFLKTLNRSCPAGSGSRQSAVFISRWPDDKQDDAHPESTGSPVRLAKV